MTTLAKLLKQDKWPQRATQVQTVSQALNSEATVNQYDDNVTYTALFCGSNPLSLAHPQSLPINSVLTQDRYQQCREASSLCPTYLLGIATEIHRILFSVTRKQATATDAFVGYARHFDSA